MIDTIEINLPAKHQYLNVLSMALDAMLQRIDNLAADKQTSYNIQLAAHEVCTNIIDHAYGGSSENRIHVTISIHYEAQRLSIRFMYGGKLFNIDAIPDEALAPDAEPHVHGYGLLLVRKIMDDVIYQRCKGENCLELVKLLIGENTL